MTRRIAALAVAFGIAAAPAAFAQPVKMSDAQLDNVAAGQGLIDIVVMNAGNANVTVNPNISPNAPVTVSISVLGLGGL
ncbi:MAG TPA: hypothetical protein VJV79_12290 [Polyangiaceae bacterium]|nr:hypothetical protein [Polyangiaceae bacterium]